VGEPAAEAATSQRAVLLATKLNVPGLQPDLVLRPRLAQRLDEARGRGLVLVCAPAGYGKTVVLAWWVRRGRNPVAWLSLDAGDNDPARFWRHAVAALDRVRPGVSERLGPLLGPPAPSSFEPLVTALINEVAGQHGDDGTLLVLDDYHVISSPPVHESLRFLLEHRPPGLQLALTSRSDPPLGLARLRAPRRAGRAARRGPAVHARGGGGPATAGGGRARHRAARYRAARYRATRCAAARYGDRGAGRPYRGVGGRAAAGRPVAARAG
jgi:hypothetical protein